MIRGFFLGSLKARNLLGKSCLRCCLRQEIICNSGRQQIKSLRKISIDNALEYLASGKNFNEDRLTGSNLWSSEDRVCSVDNKFSVISVWLILSLGIVKTELSLCLRCSGISM